MSAREVRTFEAEVPKNAKEGQTFVAIGPEGQHVDVVVPVGAVPGDRVTAVTAPYASNFAQGAAPAPVVMGVPVGEAAGPYDLEAARAPAQDHAAEAGTAMYALGWCICCFLGPFGPIFWFCTWMRHKARPRDERLNYPRERFIARLSCATGLVAITAHIVLIIAALAYFRHQEKVCSAVYHDSKCLQTPVPWLPTGTELTSYCAADCGPARCYDSQVWGGAGGEYAGGSAICGAALQAGIVKEGVGGYVLVSITQGRWNYDGAKQNGVHSRGVAGLVSPGFSVAAPDPARLGNATADSNSTATSSGAAGGNATADGDGPSGGPAAAPTTGSLAEGASTEAPVDSTTDGASSTATEGPSSTTTSKA